MNTGAHETRPDQFTQPDAGAGTGLAFPRERIVAARERLVAAIQRSPDNGELPLALGGVEMSLGNFEAALAAYSAAVLLLPKSAAAHSGVAWACQKLGRSTGASQAALRAVSLDPNDPVALKVLARIHLDAGQPEAAQRACRLLLWRDARDAEARQLMEEATAQEAILAGNLPPTPRMQPLRDVPPKMTSRRGRTERQPEEVI
jgi:cytochrome c-type biogenesis protein CcmH/NrfG